MKNMLSLSKRRIRYNFISFLVIQRFSFLTHSWCEKRKKFGKVNVDVKMSSQQRARLPPTPGSNNQSKTSASSLRYQNIDVQNNTISAVSTATDTFTTNSQIYNNNNDDTLNALGPDLALSTSQVLDSLTDHERSIILDVLSRDESVRQRDAARIM